MAVLVCGGAGYIGSHINKQLHKEGYETVVLDNLVYGHREAVKWGAFEQGDLKNTEDIERVFQKYFILRLLLMWEKALRSRKSIIITTLPIP